MQDKLGVSTDDIAAAIKKQFLQPKDKLKETAEGII